MPSTHAVPSAPVARVSARRRGTTSIPHLWLRCPRGGESAATAAIWLIALTPLAMAPGGLSRFVLAKLLVGAIAVIVASFALPAGRLPRWVALAVSLGAILLVAAAAVSPAPVAELVGRYPRYEGVLALPVYVALAWAGAQLIGPRAPSSRFATLVRALAFGALCLGVVAALEALGLRPIGGDVARPGALLGNATDQGLVGMLLLCVLAPASLRPGALLARAGLAAAVLTVVTSGSRAALLAAAVALGLLAILFSGGSPARWFRNRPVLGLGGTLVAVLAAGLLLPATRARLDGSDALAEQTLAGRWDLWSSAVALVRAHPWLGVGPSGFLDTYPSVQSATAAVTSAPLSAVDSPHNWLLQAALAGGIPLLVLAAALAVAVVATAVRDARSAVRTSAALSITGQRTGNTAPTVRADDRLAVRTGTAAALVGAAIALLTHPTSIGTLALTAILAGGALAVEPRGPNRGTLGRVLTGCGRAAAGGLVVLLALGVAGDRELDRGSALAATGRVHDADLAFGRAATLRPWDPDVALIAALSFRAGALAGDPDSADATVAWSNRALAGTPDSIEVQLALGVGLLVTATPERGADVLDRAASLAPENRMLQLLLGVALAQRGDSAAAEPHLLLATSHPATARDAWALLADLYDHAGRTADADAARAHARQAQE